MHSPKRGGEEGGPGAAEESRCQQEEQPHISQMEQNVHGVIAGGVLAVPQYGVIEEKCGGGQRAVQAGMKVGPPIILIQDLLQVGGRDFKHARISKNDERRIQCEAGGKRIRISQQGEQAKGGGNCKPVPGKARRVHRGAV